MKTHPGQEALRALMRGELSPKESQAVIRHLLTGCEACRKLASACWPRPAGESPDEVPFGVDLLGRIARGGQRRLKSERALAPELFAELERHTPARRLVLATNSRKFHTWGLCELVLEKAFDAGFSEPANAVELAEVGTALAQSLAESRYGARLVADLRMRAWAILGNARRIAGDLRGADESFETAQELVDEGSGDPLEEGQVFYLEAHLRIGQRRFREARALARRALRSFHLAGDVHRQGEVLVEWGRLERETGDLERALELTRRGFARLDSARNPRMVLVARHNLVGILQERGDLDQALELLRETLPLYAEAGGALDRLRLRWLEGKLAHAQGEYRRAERAFVELRREFLAREIPYDAALVSLDLAAIYLKEARTRELKDLAAEIVPTFEGLEIHREAIAALALFQRAVELERTTFGFLAELASYFDRARADPALRFSPSQSSP